MRKRPLAVACFGAFLLAGGPGAAYAACTVNGVTYASCTSGVNGGTGGNGYPGNGAAGRGSNHGATDGSANDGGAGGTSAANEGAGQGAAGSGGGVAPGAHGGNGNSGGGNGGNGGAGGGGGGSLETNGVGGGGGGGFTVGGLVGGGGGGGGGVGLAVSANYTIQTGTAVVGGAGGVGGNIIGGGSGGNGGGSGGGGAGLLIADGTTVYNLGAVAGGNGGNQQRFFFGGGGGGGAGVVVQAGGLFHSSGTVVGGNGGNSDVGGGGGGAGVVAGGGATVTNGGTILGGHGGAAGHTPGSGGAGVIGLGGLSLVNGGTISGGLAGNGITRADAVDLSGGGNVLTLENGYTFVGNVVSTSGAANGDTLALGGDANGAFNLGGLVASAPTSWTGTVQYYGFSKYAKTGASTWQLTGTAAGITAPWQVDGGTLEITSGANPGTGSITVDNTTNQNATLKVDGGASLTNWIILDNGATLDNAGVIANSSGNAVTANVGSATVNNHGGGSIGSLAGNAVELFDGGTVNNTGTGSSLTTQAPGMAVVYVTGAAGTVNNTDGASISNSDGAITLNAGGAVVNDGVGSTIASTSSQYVPVYINTATGAVTNSNGAVISGGGGGVVLAGGGNVTNVGAGSAITATDAGSYGVEIGGAAGTVANAGGGVIGGVNGGIALFDGGNVTNVGAGSAITATATGSYGVEISGATGTVANAGGGVISGAYGGVILYNGGTVTNDGAGSVIRGTAPTAGYGGNGVQINGAAGTVSNTNGALITGVGAGVMLTNGGTVSNGAGSIIETTGSVAGDCWMQPAACAIYSASASDGSGFGGALVLNNAGNIIGNVQMDPDAENVATLTAGGSIAGDLSIGSNAQSKLTLDGGAGTSQLYSQAVTGTTTFDGALIKAGTGTWVIDTNDLSSVASTAVSAGTLQVGNGGTTGSIGNGSVTDAGSLVFDRSDALDFGGVITGTGSLTQMGTGTLTLDGNSGAFAGNTTVAAGTLVIGSVAGNGAELGGNVTVASGATLGGHGSVGGNVEVLSGGAVAPGNSIGTLTVNGDFTAAQGSLLDYQFGLPGADFQTSGSGDSVHVGGNLVLDGATLNVANAGGMGPGLYNVFTYGGTLTEAHGGLALNNPTGQALTVQTLTAQKQINLIDTTGLTLNFWNANGQASSTQMGGGSGTWSTVGAAWTDANGSVPNLAMQPQPGFGVFGGAAGTVTVDDSQGGVSATGMQFAVNGYALTGDPLTLVASGGAGPVIRVGNASSAGASMTATIDAVLAGTAGLTKTDLGTLVLGGANTFTGGVAVEGGTLSVSSDGNLGAASGGLALNGSTLENTAGFTTNRTVTLGASGGTLQTDAALTASGAMGGQGALTKTGAATLTLPGANAFTGGTTISAGAVVVGNDASLGTGAVDMAAGTVLSFAATGLSLANGFAMRGDPTIDVAAGQTDAISGAIIDGATAGALAKTGGGTLVLTGSNTFTGGTTISAGTLQVGNGGTAGSMVGDIANNGALAFDRADAATFGGVLTGNGTLTQMGTGMLTLDGASGAFAGATTVASGSLRVGDADHAGADLGGMVTVSQGATIGGVGSVGGLDLAGSFDQGATLGSLGTLHVVGNATFEAGSTFALQATPTGQSDQLAAAGSVTIKGGSVVTIAQAGNWAPRTSYAIVTAGQGVTGTFGSVSDNLAFLTAVLSYQPNAVELSLERNDINFQDVAQTRNETGAATGANGLGWNSPVYNALVKLDAPTARFAFDQLSGEFDASQQTARIQDSRYVREAMNQRLREGDAGDVQPIGGTKISAWANAWGHWGTVASDGNAGRLADNGDGLLLGMDLPVGAQGRLGVTGGASRDSLSVGSRGSWGRVTSQWLGAFGGFERGPLALRGGVAYGWDQVPTNRVVQFPGFSDRLSGNANGNSRTGFVEGAWRFRLAQGEVAPFINLAHTRVETGQSTEAGGAAALHASEATANVSFGTVGARGQWQLAGHFDVHGELGWQHAVGDTAPERTLRFVAGGDAFSEYAAPLAANAGLGRLGLGWHRHNVSVAADYEGLSGGGIKDQAARLSVGVAF